jgi:hypothetical protein
MHKLALEDKIYKTENLVDQQKFENGIKGKDKGVKNNNQFRIYRGEN